MLAEPLTHGAEEDAGVGAGKDGLKADAVAAAFARVLPSLVGHSLGHGDGADPPGLQTTAGIEATASNLERGSVWPGGGYLGDHNVAVRRSAPFDEAVQDELRNLGGLSTACGSSDEHHGVTVDGGQDLLLKVFDGQLVPLQQHLKASASASASAWAWNRQQAWRVLVGWLTFCRLSS